MLTVPTHARVVQLELEVPIAAPPERVWRALVEEPGAWWPRDFYSSEQARGLVLEPRLGGRMYEDWGEGAGRTWYTVQGLQPGRLLELSGHLTPAFGGPATTLLQLVLEARAPGTLLRLTEALVGRVTDDKAEQAEEGWRFLMEEGLRRYVEGRQV